MVIVKETDALMAASVESRWSLMWSLHTINSTNQARLMMTMEI